MLDIDPTTFRIVICLTDSKLVGTLNVDIKRTLFQVDTLFGMYFESSLYIFRESADAMMYCPVLHFYESLIAKAVFITSYIVHTIGLLIDHTRISKACI